MNQQHLTYAQCSAALHNAQSGFAALRKKYPQMKAYLVIALRGEQAEDITDWKKVLHQFPTLITGGPDHEKLRQTLATELPKNATHEEEMHHRQLIQHYAQTCTYRPDALIELRFHDLDYPLLDQLRQDPLVDQTHTPQTRASIRIVLGSLYDFSGNRA